MSNVKKWFYLCVLLFLLVTGNAAVADDEEYRLGYGDVISISVWGYEELQAEELPIRPDGKIALPLAGEIPVSGLTPQELMDELTAAIGQYVKDPKVTVNIVKFRTTRVYVLGEVVKPGLYELEKSHRLLDALSAAGGFTKSSAKNKVYLVRHGDQKNYTLVDLNKMLRKGDLAQNYQLAEGDMIFLTRNTLDYMKDILPFITAWASVYDAVNND